MRCSKDFDKYYAAFWRPAGSSLFIYHVAASGLLFTETTLYSITDGTGIPSAIADGDIFQLTISGYLIRVFLGDPADPDMVEYKITDSQYYISGEDYRYAGVYCGLNETLEPMDNFTASDQVPGLVFSKVCGGLIR